MTILWTTPPASFTVGGVDYAPGLEGFETSVESPVETGLMRSQADVTVRRWAGFAGDLLPNRGAFRLGTEVVFAIGTGVVWRGRIYRLLSATTEPDSISFRVVDALWFYDNPRPAGSYIYPKPSGTVLQPTPFLVSTGGQPLNVRSAPNPSANIIRTVANGQTVMVVELRDGWARLQAGGWVMQLWLTPPEQTHPFSGGYGISGGYFRTGVTVRDAIANILGWAGWEGTLSGGADLNIPTYNPINKEEGEGLVSHAGRLAWEYGHYLYQTPDGQIHLRRFTGEGSTTHTYSCQTATVQPDFDFSITDTSVSVEATGWRLEAADGQNNDEGERQYEIEEDIYDRDSGLRIGKIRESLRWTIGVGGQAVRTLTTEEEWTLSAVFPTREMLPGTDPAEKVSKTSVSTDIYNEGRLIESREVVSGHGVFLPNPTVARDWVVSWSGNRQNPTYRTLLTTVIDISEKVTTYQDYTQAGWGIRDYGLRAPTERGILARMIVEEKVNVLAAGRIILEPNDNGVMGGTPPPLVLRSETETLYGQNYRTKDWEKIEIRSTYEYDGQVVRPGGLAQRSRQGRRRIKQFPPEREPPRIPTLSRVADIQLPGEPEPRSVPLVLRPFTFAVTAPTTATSPNPAGQCRYLRAEYLSREGYAQYYANLMAAIISGQLSRVRLTVPYNPNLFPWDLYRITGARYAGDYWCIGIRVSWTKTRFCTEAILIPRATVSGWPTGSQQPPTRREGVG